MPHHPSGGNFVPMLAAWTGQACDTFLKVGCSRASLANRVGGVFVNRKASSYSVGSHGSDYPIQRKGRPQDGDLRSASRATELEQRVAREVQPFVMPRRMVAA